MLASQVEGDPPAQRVADESRIPSVPSFVSEPHDPGDGVGGSPDPHLSGRRDAGLAVARKVRQDDEVFL